MFRQIGSNLLNELQNYLKNKYDKIRQIITIF